MEYEIGKFRSIGKEGYEGTILKNGKKIADFENNGRSADSILFDEREYKNEFIKMGEKLKSESRYVNMEMDGEDVMFRIILDRYIRLKEQKKYSKKGYEITMIGVLITDIDKQFNFPGQEMTIAGHNVEDIKKEAKRIKCEELYEIDENGDLINKIIIK